ncbi:MAG: hypothetical protein M3416_13740 [Acidobacteriota bacterium]|nr:hypothetical protein [Acidobacteriota bacterium]
MRRALLALATSLALSADQRITVLDTTMIGEKWLIVAGVLASAACGVWLLSVFLYTRSRNKARRWTPSPY